MLARTSVSLAFLASVAALLLMSSAVRADWPRSPYQSVWVGPDPDGLAAWPTVPYLQTPVVSDGQKGFIAVWPRNGYDNPDLFAQRVDSSADRVWGDGMVINDAPSHQLYPVAVADAFGGAFVVWLDWRDRGPDVYAQHIGADGFPLWDPSGVVVCTAPEPQSGVVAASDGEGGLLIAWMDARDQGSGSSPDIYAQRLGTSGEPLWGHDGRAISTGPFEKSIPRVVPAGNGAGFVAWREGDSVWVVLINRDGIPAWESPRQIADHADLAAMVSDGAGGAFVGLRSGWIQHVTASGTLAWGSSGVSVVVGGERLMTGVEDGSGGTYWLIYASDRNYRLHHLDDVGTPWPTPRDLATGSVAFGATLIRDGAGGAIATWVDGRDGEQHIYASRLDSLGFAIWGTTGLPVYVGPGQKSLLGSVTDGAHGLIVVWENNGGDVLAQRVDSAGSMLPLAVGSPNGITLETAIPNPSWEGVTIRFVLQDRAYTRVSVLDVGGRLVRRIYEGQLDAGPHVRFWSGSGNNGLRLASGMYIVLVEALGKRVSTRVVLLGSSNRWVFP